MFLIKLKIFLIKLKFVFKNVNFKRFLMMKKKSRFHYLCQNYLSIMNTYPRIPEENAQLETSKVMLVTVP